jgi:hypothetical protein
VAGLDASPKGAYGVLGFSRVGVGVFGEGISGGIGVLGESNTYFGVSGYSDSGTGVYATSPDGYALQTSGVARFSG